MFAYCNNNPVNHSDPSGQILAQVGTSNFFYKVLSAIVRNVQFRTHVTTPSVMVDGGSLLGEVGFSSTVTHEANSVGGLYSFNDVGNDEVRNGIGVNLGEWLGCETGISSEGNLFTDIQITPHTHFEGTIGFDGIGITTGFTDKNVSHDLTIRAGWGAVAAAFVAPKVIAFVIT